MTILYYKITIKSFELKILSKIEYDLHYEM